MPPDKTTRRLLEAGTSRVVAVSSQPNVGEPTADAAIYGSFPTHAIASRIAEAAKDMGYKVRRSAAGPKWRSAYVFCDAIKVRVADHPNNDMPDIDVHVGDARPGAVDWQTAVEWLRGKQR
jgi:hypothetical protein